MSENTTKLTVLLMTVFAITAGTFFVTEQIYASEADRGKTIIKEYQQHPTPEHAEIQRLYDIYTSKNSTTIEKQAALEKIEDIKATIPSTPAIPTEKWEEIRQKMDVLAPMMIQLREQGIPINVVGVDYENKSLKIGLEKNNLTGEKIQDSVTAIRNIVGTKIDITVHPTSKIVYSSCSQTGDCKPVQGGVKIEVENGLECSMGMKASYDSKTGFVTAGHCNSSDIGGTGEDVGNPTDSSSDVLGTVHANAFGNYTWCDCLFVDASEQISAKVYEDISLSGTLYPAEDDWVIMEGHASQGEVGQIESTYEHFAAEMPNGDVYITQGAVKVTFTGDPGDSGGTVYEDTSGGSTPEFAGIFSANNENGTGSYYIPYYRITNEFSGLSFTFS